MSGPISLTIDRLSYGGGRGVGRYDGLVIFVPFTAPGDEVLVEITKKKKKYAEARLVKILKSSPHRREALCPYHGKCGGCSWQHVEYDEQVKQKDSFLRRSLKSFPHPEDIEVLPFIPAPKEFRYRNRVQLHLKRGSFGYFGRRSKNLVVIDDCLIADEKLIDHLKTLDLKSLKDQRIEIAMTEDGYLSERLDSFSPELALFSQVNTDLNKVLIRLVLDAAQKLGPHSTILDLFCGNGNLSFPLNKAFPQSQTIGVELSQSSILRAQEKLRENPEAKIKFVCADVEKYLKNADEKADLVILDPPRAGLSKEMIQYLKNMGPKSLIYVSCHLATAQRDLVQLCEGYKILSLQGMDMFPQTEYLETVVVLEKI